MDSQSDEPMVQDGEQPQTDCCICRDKLINAVQLDCGHVFCHMCIKSAAETTGTCALCRQDIGDDFNFRDHEIVGLSQIPFSANGLYWYYEGFKGWWLYDVSTGKKLEDAYQQGQSSVEVFIAGHLYLIDLTNMEQRRKDNEGRSRKICRNTLHIENVIGMAGIKGQDFTEMLEMMRSAGQMEMFKRN